jgi:hypothetical protein
VLIEEYFQSIGSYIKVVFRYDMAPHHKEIKTFPHHKHLGSEKVIESLAPSLGEVLQEIEGILILPWDSD